MRDRLRDPVWWTNASQRLKTVDTAIGIGVGLLVNLRNILEALDVVAAAQPVRVPAGVA